MAYHTHMGLFLIFDNTRACSIFREFTSGLVQFLYGDRWRTRIAGLQALYRAAKQ